MPLVGSGRPAARSAFAKAVGRSDALAITSPVERISGPSTGSAPGKRAKGSTAAFTLISCGRGGFSARSASVSPAARRQAASTRLMPIALLANGTVRDARGFASSTYTVWSATASCTFSRPTTPSAGPRRLTTCSTSSAFGQGERLRGEHAGGVAGVDARFLHVLHDRCDEHLLAVAESVDVDLDRVLDEPVDQHRPAHGRHRGPQLRLVVADTHGTAAEDVRGPHEHRVADLRGGRQRLRLAFDRGPRRTTNAELAPPARRTARGPRPGRSPHAACP